MRGDFYDIAIIGGGPAGLALAAGLAPLGLRLALIERQAIAPQITTAFDGRTIALAHQGVQLMQKTGVWKKLSRTANPIAHIRVADQFSPLKLDFDAAELKQPAFGYMVENRHLRAALWDKIKSLKNLDVYIETSVTQVDSAGSLATLALQQHKKQTTLQAALVIGADGRTSPSRAALGIDSFKLSYDQQALICTVAHGNPHHNTALEHFLPQGPFATLPLTEQRSGIVWTAQPATIKALMALSETAFIDALYHAGAGFLGDLTLATPRATYPLHLQHARAYIAPHFMLVGDAAHVMHPIAGQGFNMGLRDVACVVDLLAAAQRRGLRADDTTVLAQYEQQRRADNQAMLAATDTLDRLFSNYSRTLAVARQLGLAAVDRCGPLRRFFMQQAMGASSSVA